MPRPATWLTLSLTLVLSGCVLRPAGTTEERTRLTTAGQPYAPPVEQRELPDVPDPADWRSVLRRAFLANGDLESAYFDWAAAMARIDQAATWPNSNLAPTFNYMFSGGRMKAWDRTTVNVGFDPMQNVSFPTKTAKAGQLALENARAAGQRFAARKFALQKQVLQAWLDASLQAEQIRIQTDNVSLLKLLSDSAADRVRAGAPQQDLLKAQIAYRLAEAELSKVQADHQGMLATLNGMMGRRPDEPLNLPPTLPDARPVRADDARLIAAAVDANPELTAFARDIASRKDALELARMRFIPDINPSAAFTGSVSQAIGAMVVLPTMVPAIRASIEEARAMLRSSEAVARQAKADRAASFVAALWSMRNAEKLVTLYRDTVLPKAEQALASSRQAYAAGQIAFVELIDSQRTLLDVRLMIAQARVEREKRLADLEALAGVDVETLPNPTTQPTTKPSEVKP
jgi:cobalt-zinc-cadmium efflux system outer membrane protein